VGAGPALVFFAAPEASILARSKPAELLYSLTWGYLWKDYFVDRALVGIQYIWRRHLVLIQQRKLGDRRLEGTMSGVGGGI
jgi:hypothetical protein